MFQPEKFEDRLLGTAGFSDKLLTTHFGLYEGYVKNSNLLLETLATLVKEKKAEGPQFNELKRRLGWEFNGMRLHELYFWNMNKEKFERDAAPELMKQIETDFGSYEDWFTDFMATGTMRGIGWVILYFDPISKRLINVWVEEHAMNHLAGCQPILVLDVFEHAYMPDYGTSRADYMKSFFSAIDWKIVNARYTSTQQFLDLLK